MEPENRTELSGRFLLEVKDEEDKLHHRDGIMPVIAFPRRELYLALCTAVCKRIHLRKICIATSVERAVLAPCLERTIRALQAYNPGASLSPERSLRPSQPAEILSSVSRPLALRVEAAPLQLAPSAGSHSGPMVWLRLTSGQAASRGEPIL